jgi:hypothetical protein
MMFVTPVADPQKFQSFSSKCLEVKMTNKITRKQMVDMMHSAFYDAAWDKTRKDPTYLWMDAVLQCVIDNLHRMEDKND